MKPFYLALAAVLTASNAFAGAETPRFGKIEIDTVGCRDKEDAFRFVRLMAAGDNVAGARFFAEKAPACLVYRGGSTVEIERESTLQFKMTCARLKGEPECRWLASDLVTRD